MEEEGVEKERSLSDSPSWAVATVITGMIVVGFIVNSSLKWFGKDALEIDQLIDYFINKEDSEGMVLLGHSTSCQVIFSMADEHVPEYVDKKALVERPQVRRGGGYVPANRGSGRGVPLYGRDRGRGRVWGRGQGRKQPVEKSAEELNKELDNYHAEAMQTS